MPSLRAGLRACKPLFAAAALLLAAACVTPEKRLEQGMELEERGRPADAARRYIDALKRDPTLEDARRRLHDSGNRAVGDYLAQSAAAASAGQSGEAADILLRADDLMGDAAAVGARLDPGPDYPARRRQTLDRAIDDAVAGARSARAGQGWQGAVSLLERARERWQPSPAQRAELERARFDVQLAWAEWELEQGRFRGAYERAEAAMSVYGRGSQEAARALDVQEEALRRGTARVAALPVVAAEHLRRRLPEDLLDDLNDALAQEHWDDSPLFVEVVDPQGTAREVRRLGYSRRVISTREAANVGERMGAELVVVAEVDSIATEERDVRSTRRPVRTREGVDTAYTVREGRERGRARVSLAVIDVGGRRVLDEGQVWAEGDSRFRRGVYAGDPRTLSLSREDRDLFDTTSAEERERARLRELVDQLAERISGWSFDMVIRRVD